MTALLLIVVIALGSFALPLGLLPSVLAFRGLADGLDASERTKRLYAATLWGGLGLAWLVGSAAVFAVLHTLFG